MLAGGVLAAVQHEPPLPPRPPLPGNPVPGVAASVAVTGEEELVVRLVLDLRLAGLSDGRGDTAGGPQPELLRLLGVTARGFAVALPRRSPPLVLGEVGRFGSGRAEVVRLDASLVVADCSVEVGAQRRIALVLRRGDGPTATLFVASDPAVVRALDGLVSRTCRRPRG